MDRLSVGSVQVIIRVKSNQAEQGIGGWWGGVLVGWWGVGWWVGVVGGSRQTSCKV